MANRNNFTKGKKVLIGILLSLVIIIGGGAAFFAAFLLPWKNVYAIAKGTKIYQYSMSNEIIEQADALNIPAAVLSSQDPTSIAERQVLTSSARNELMYERLFYVMGLKDGFTATQDETNASIDAFKKKVNQGTNESIEQSYKDELSTRGVTGTEFSEILKENIISQKEKDKLTANITLSDEELKAYIKEWGFGYDSKNPNRQEAYTKNMEQIKKDALNMKKQDYISATEKKLLSDSMNEISFDNTYKKFMRWFEGSFLGVTIPDQYKPESSMQ